MNTTLGCSANHILIFTDKPINTLNPGETFNCKVCSKSNFATAGRWTCASCNYSVCSVCRRPPYRNFACPAGHTLSWTNASSIPPGLNASCQNCGGSCNVWGNFWACFTCSFNICVHCKREPFSQPTCSAGHILAWSVTEYPGSNGLFECKQCLSVQYAHAGRWSCSVCTFDICNACKIGGSAVPSGPFQPIPPQQYPSQPTAPQSTYPPQQVYGVQPSVYNSPQPMYVSSPPLIAQPQILAPSPMFAATQPVFVTPPVYMTSQPSYVAVPRFVGPQGFVALQKPKGMKCANQHPLLLSKAVDGYPNSSYTCVYCGGQFPCMAQRWHCDKCKYNVCKKCLNP